MNILNMPKKTIVEYPTYIKDKQIILVDLDNVFVYEVTKFCYYDKYFALSGKKYFESIKEIQGVVGSFFKTPNLQICCELFSAPEKWLKENGFQEYHRPIKVKKVPKIKIENNG
jgi:hypothetical protein